MSLFISPAVEKAYSRRRKAAASEKEAKEEELLNSYPDVAALLKRRRAAYAQELLALALEKYPDLAGDTGEAAKKPKAKSKKDDFAYLDDEFKKRCKRYGFETDFFIREPHLCEDCKDSGLQGSKYCLCYPPMARKHEQEELAFFANPSHHFEAYDSSLFRDAARAGAMKNAVLAFADEFSPGSGRKGFYFSGPTGSGKTFLASCLFNEVFKQGYNAVFINAAKLIEIIQNTLVLRATFDPDPDLREINSLQMRRISGADLIIIDDFGNTPISQDEYPILLNLLDDLENNKSSLILTSNLGIKELDENLDNRVASRILGMTKVIKQENIDLRRRRT